MRRRAATWTFTLAIALVAVAPIARACWCIDQSVEAACDARAGELFFTGRVRRIETEGRIQHVTIVVLRGIRGVGRTARIQIGSFGYANDISSCDPSTPSLAVGSYVRVIAHAARIDTCDRVEVLGDRAEALRDPCR